MVRAAVLWLAFCGGLASFSTQARAQATAAAGGTATGEGSAAVTPEPPLFESLDIAFTYVGIHRPFRDLKDPSTAHGGGVWVAGRFRRYLLAEMQLMLAAGTSEDRTFIAPRAGVGLRAFTTPVSGLRLHAAAALVYGGISVASSGPEGRTIEGGAIEAGGGLTIRIAQVFTCADLAITVDVREQVAYTSHGVEQGPTWIIGIGGFDRATLDRGAPHKTCTWQRALASPLAP